MAKFSEVDIGQQFSADNKVWVKVETKKVKRCCGNKGGSYNAYLASNKKTRKLFSNNKEVTIV